MALQSPDLLLTLRQHFGFDSFRPGQEVAIQRVLAGQHTLLVMPTGFGKSLAYQLPALLLPGLTLVISPLIALMKDQVDALLDAQLPATYINSSLPSGEQNLRLRAMREGHVKLVYVAPERLRSRHFIRALARVSVSLLAVDEAHCVSQWGHDFRPDYLQIRPAWEGLGRPPLLATTATATPKVQADILKLLGPADAERIITGFDRPNLTFEVRYAATDHDKLRLLRQLLLDLSLDLGGGGSGKRSQMADTGLGSVIIYVGTRRAAEEVAAFARDVLGLRAEAYHAGLDPDLRHRVQDEFMNDRLPLVAATNAFGMGVDKPDIRAVIHYHIPGTVEAYYQEAGRAGRDGLPAHCVLLFSPEDRGLQAWFIDSDTPGLDDLRTVQALVGRVAQDGEALVSRDELADASSLHPVKVRVALSELEQAGALLHLGSEAGYSRWRVLSPPKGTLKARTKAIAARADRRHQLLGRMIAYAESDACRRRFLLDYFGDSSPFESREVALCCDNCRVSADATELPPAKSAQDWVPLVVLETARTLPRPVGRTRLAQILKGSRASNVLRMGYNRHKLYGKLAHLTQERITAVVDALVEARYLALTGEGRMLVLTLTSTGLAALKARVAIPLSVHVPAPPDPALAKRPGGANRSTTVAETLALHRQGLTPARIAEARELTLNTIYNHLARLVEDGEIELEAIVAADVIAQVRAVVEEVGVDYLAPIKQRLPDTISYGEIRCVVARLEPTVASSGGMGEARGNQAQVGAGGSKGQLDQSHIEAEPAVVTQSSTCDEELFERLRQWRAAQAREQQVPAYVIFHDRVLRAIATSLPTDPDALGAIPGVGPAKLERYAHTVVSIVQAHLSDSAQTASSPSSAPEPETGQASALEGAESAILAAVADLSGLLSRSGLAKLLTGSPSTRVAAYRDHPLYGVLHVEWKRQDVTAEIDRLLAEGYLDVRRGGLVLSLDGQSYLGQSPRLPSTPPKV